MNKFQILTAAFLNLFAKKQRVIKSQTTQQEEASETLACNKDEVITNQPINKQGAVRFTDSVSAYIKGLEESSDINSFFISSIRDAVRISRLKNSSVCLAFNYGNSMIDGNETKNEETLTLLANPGKRWKKLTSNPITLHSLDKFVEEFEAAFEQHGYNSFHNSATVFSDFIVSTLIPIAAKQKKLAVSNPEITTHIRLTLRAYTDNPSDPHDTPTIAATVSYIENNIPSTVSLNIKYQKMRVSSSV